MKITVTLKMLTTRKGRKFIDALLAQGYTLSLTGAQA